MLGDKLHKVAEVPQENIRTIATTHTGTAGAGSLLRLAHLLKWRWIESTTASVSLKSPMAITAMFCRHDMAVWASAGIRGNTSHLTLGLKLYSACKPSHL